MASGIKSFEDFKLNRQLLNAIDDMGYSDPTPIQVKAIPLALAGHDMMGIAQTGTGKTVAFVLPILMKIKYAQGNDPRALILAPTRELALQIEENLNKLSRYTDLRIVALYGGIGPKAQIEQIAQGADVIVATPGRIMDIYLRGELVMKEVKTLVLDEADQMLDMGFIHALRKIAPRLGSPRQTMLFSATMPKQMEELSRAYLTEPRRVQVAPPGKAVDKIAQSVHFVEKAEKPGKLREILSRDPEALTLVFGRTKHGSEKLMKGLVADGYNAASLHGNKSQGQRDRAIKAFRDGTVRILVATDVAARGIDIPGVAYVINYELPEVPENYVHRIGRTARAGREGEAIAFCSAEEVDLLNQIERLMKIEVPVAGGTKPAAVSAAKQRRRGGGGGGGQRFHGAKPANGPGHGKPSGQKRRRPRRPRAA